MKYVVQVPAKLFTGSMGIMDYKTRQAYAIQAGTFLRYAATDNYEVWAITCDEQSLLTTILKHTITLLDYST